MEIWLSQGTEKLRLPVNPATIQVSRSAQNQSSNVNGVGEVTLIGKMGLASYPFESFFPKNNAPYCQYSEFPSPSECIKLIESWMASGKPIQFRATQYGIDTLASIESFSYGPRGAFGDMNYSLDLKEYRQLTVKTEATLVAKRQVKPVTKSYVVKPGDTLQIIAKRTTGSSSNWQKIAKANNIKNGKITTGQKLVIV